MESQVPVPPSSSLQRFDATSLLEAPPSSPSKSLFQSFSSSTSSSTPQKRSSGKKEGDNGGGGASYKYLTWREKDRRRRFREEWKNLWLVVPYGSYEVVRCSVGQWCSICKPSRRGMEVMCLVCHKIMTQRKLDTIKRHTIRRHAELLSMSEEQRQRLYQELSSERFRHFDGVRPYCTARGAFGNSASATVLPSATARVRQDPSAPKHPRMHCESGRPHVFGSAMPAFRMRKPEAAPSKQMPGSPFNPMRGRPCEGLTPPGPTPAMLAKLFAGIRQPPQMYMPGGREMQVLRNIPSVNHICGLGQSATTATPHAFYPVKKVPPPFHISSSNPLLPLPPQPPSSASPLDILVPLDMSKSSRSSLIEGEEASSSLTERLTKLVSAWDSAARHQLSIPRQIMNIPPPPPTLLLNR